MARYLLRRLAAVPALLLAVSVLAFLLVQALPGDPAVTILGNQATPEQYAAVHAQLGLDDSVVTQYWDWLKGVLQGDFGTSLFGSLPVADAIWERMNVTLTLVIGATLVSVLAGIAWGTLAALRGGALDRALQLLATIGMAIPNFGLALLLVLVFAIWLPWLPPTGYVRFADSPGDWLRSIVLPVLALGAGGTAAIAQQMRSSMLTTLGREYVRSLRARGLPASRVVGVHAMRNAVAPVLTVVGLQFIGMLGGTLLVEQVFAIQGLGALAIEAVNRKDIPIIQGVVVSTALVVVVVNLLLDVGYGWLNPKARQR